MEWTPIPFQEIKEMQRLFLDRVQEPSLVEWIRKNPSVTTILWLYENGDPTRPAMVVELCGVKSLQGLPEEIYNPEDRTVFRIVYQPGDYAFPL